MNCKNCDTEVTQNYCPNCGQPAQLKRINGHYIAHEIEHVLHFERGILYTVRELLTNPGENVRHYISENRSRLVKPIIFIVVTSLLYSISTQFFHIKDGYVNFEDDKESTTKLIFGWIQGHYGYANILMGVPIALWTKLFFRKYGYNFFEILILLCFIMGMGMLIIAVFAIIQGLTHIYLMGFSGVLTIVYITWAIGQFFDKRKVASYLKAFAAYALGLGIFYLLVFMMGDIVDSIIKH